MAVGQTVVLAAFTQWPPTLQTAWFSDVEVPVTGFPFGYQVQCAVSGAYYLTAFLDVNPNDGSSVNTQIDPTSIPQTMTTIVSGQNTIVDFNLVDNAWQGGSDDALE